MAQKQQGGGTSPDNKRKFERVAVKRPVKMEATLRGRFIDIMRLEMSGVTIDMSEGGFCANVDQSIAPGARCRVELAAEDGGEPHNIWGRARRCTSSKNGFVVALEFDEPVAALEALQGAGAVSADTTADMLGPGNGGDDDATLEMDAEDEDAAVEAAGEKKPATKKKTTRKRKTRARKKTR